MTRKLTIISMCAIGQFRKGLSLRGAVVSPSWIELTFLVSFEGRGSPFTGFLPHVYSTIRGGEILFTTRRKVTKPDPGFNDDFDVWRWPASG